MSNTVRVGMAGSDKTLPLVLDADGRVMVRDIEHVYMLRNVGVVMGTVEGGMSQAQFHLGEVVWITGTSPPLSLDAATAIAEKAARAVVDEYLGKKKERADNCVIA